MSKTNKTRSTTNNTKTQKMEEVMKDAELKLEVKPTEEKERRIRHSFNDSILMKIDVRAKDLNAEDYFPIRERIAAALAEIQKLIDDNKDFIRTERALRNRLSKFSKEQIENYLKHLG